MSIMKHIPFSKEEEESKCNSNLFNNKFNSFEEAIQSLWNIVTVLLVDKKVSKKFLNIFEIGCINYNVFLKKQPR